MNAGTGELRVNAEGSLINGELTEGALQKIVDWMKDLGFKKLMFIEVGSGEVKPNLHVSQDPGVAISIGVEVVRNG
jgi:hypothetical protein